MAHSRLDRIYAARHLQCHLFSWKHSPAIAHTDHWMVMGKYTPKDVPFVGDRRWSWPRATLKDNDLIKKLVAKENSLQTSVNEWKTNRAN
jgi:hypothetical protein